MVPATRPAVGGTIRLFVPSKMRGVSLPCSPPYRCDFLWIGGGNTKSRRAKAGDTSKQAYTGCFAGGYLYSAWRMEGSGEEIRHARLDN